MNFNLGLLTMMLMTGVAQAADCSKEAKSLATDEYVQSYGDPAGISVRAVTAKDGSVYYEVTVGKRNPEDGPVTYTVIFDDPSCAKDTARVYEKKR